MRIAINGLGRIGRQALRALHAAPGLELVALNDLADPEGLAHLVKYDSVHGKAGFPVAAGPGALVLDGRAVPLSREADPARTPFADLGAELVLECTGLFPRRDLALRHLRGSVARVLIGAPVPDADATLLPSVDPARPIPAVLSAACPASHALALLVRVLDAEFGVEGGIATAVESYGNDQRILDLPHPDPRLARAATMSMIPAPSHAARCLGEALPWTRGRFEATAVRVPTPDVSILDLTAILARDADPESLNAAFGRAAQELPGLVAILEDPLVSVDLRGRTASCILDPWLTRRLAPRFVKVFAWYDNEAAYAARLCDLCREVAR